MKGLWRCDEPIRMSSSNEVSAGMELKAENQPIFVMG
jgi:hypothetical protein